MIVYIYTFPNGKKYIGQTIQSLNDRAKRGEGYKESSRVYNAIKKYGWDNIQKETIECNSYEEMNVLEIELISKFRTQEREFGYNIARGGNAGPLTEEHKERIGESLKKYYQSSEGIKARKENSIKQKKLIESRKEEFNKYLQKARENITEESLLRSTQALKEYYQSEEHQEERKQNGLKGAKARSKAVIVFKDKDKQEVVGIYESGRKAAKELNIDHSIPSYALNHNHYGKGYYFYLYEDLTPRDTDWYRVFGGKENGE